MTHRGCPRDRVGNRRAIFGTIRPLISQLKPDFLCLCQPTKLHHMREHQIGPVVVELRQTLRNEKNWVSKFRILTVAGRQIIAQGEQQCPREMDPEGLQLACETLLWMTTEDAAGDPDDPEWAQLCRGRLEAIVDEELWEELENEMSESAIDFEQARCDVEDGRSEDDAD